MTKEKPITIMGGGCPEYQKEKPLRRSKPHTAERKKNISKGLTGHKRSLEEIRNMSESRKGISVKHEGQFKKGMTPWNKKDNHNKRKIVKVDGFLNPRLNSRYIWEKYHRQNIPFGFVIHHIDEDCSNDDINNLRLMRKEDHNFLHQMIDRERYRKSKQVERLKRFIIHNVSPICNSNYPCNECLNKEIDEIFGEFK